MEGFGCNVPDCPYCAADRDRLAASDLHCLAAPEELGETRRFNATNVRSEEPWQ